VIGQQLRWRELDLMICEEVGRVVREHDAARLFGIAVDHGTRVVSPIDCIVSNDDERIHQDGHVDPHYLVSKTISAGLQRESLTNWPDWGPHRWASVVARPAQDDKKNAYTTQNATVVGPGTAVSSPGSVRICVFSEFERLQSMSSTGNNRGGRNPSLFRAVPAHGLR
jgi:hypothetical protein